jgi:DNA-binding winged helix-turn-helix (wHTH) protein
MQTYPKTVQTQIEGDFYIDQCLIQPCLNRIVCGENTIQIQPKIMQVLVCLVEHPGQVVTKDQLFRSVWADTHVTEHVLSRAISELRKIFGDDPKKPMVIETIPKVGYRLIAAVSKAEEPQSDYRQFDPLPEINTTGKSRWVNRAIFGLIALSGLMLFLFFVISYSSIGHRFLHIFTHRH